MNKVKATVVWRVSQLLGSSPRGGGERVREREERETGRETGRQERDRETGRETGR